MNILFILIVGFMYLIIGRVIAKLKWEWDGYGIWTSDVEEVLVTFFWPLYLIKKALDYIANLFIY